MRLTQTTTIIGAILTGMLAAGSPAQADEVAPPTELEQDWYGWQVLAADATGLLATVGCVSAVHDDVCLAAYFIAAPSVHLSRRRPAQALGSLGLRVALPLAGAFIGLQAASCREDSDCGVGALVGGVLIGTLTASVIDALALSTVITERPGIVTHTRISFLSPNVSTGPSGTSFGLRGTF
jgi:hypothetical protein